MSKIKVWYSPCNLDKPFIIQGNFKETQKGEKKRNLKRNRQNEDSQSQTRGRLLQFEFLLFAQVADLVCMVEQVKRLKVNGYSYRGNKLATFILPSP